jgi:hypothetical protein
MGGGNLGAVSVNNWPPRSGSGSILITIPGSVRNIQTLRMFSKVQRNFKNSSIFYKLLNYTKIDLLPAVFDNMPQIFLGRQVPDL